MDGGGPYPPYWPVLRRLSGRSGWPQMAVVLPGNEGIFSLETASDYVRDEKACFYGFRCLVQGYEWGPGSASPSSSSSGAALVHLETELAYLGGMCSASLLRRDLLLPPASVEEVEEDMD